MKSNVHLIICLYLGFSGLVLFSGSALADCHTSPFQFLYQGDTANVATIISDGSSCHLSFHAGAKSTFESAEISTKPAHGSLTQLSKADYTYLPSKGFKGNDNFKIKICGTSAGANGCSFISYNVTSN